MVLQSVDPAPMASSYVGTSNEGPTVINPARLKGMKPPHLCFNGTVVDNGDGTYDCRAMTTVAGNYNVVIDASRKLDPEAEAEAAAEAKLAADEAAAMLAEGGDEEPVPEPDPELERMLAVASVTAAGPRRCMSFAAAVRLSRIAC